MSIDRLNISNRGIDASQAIGGVESAKNAEKARKPATAGDSIAISSQAKDIERLYSAVEQSRIERFNRVRAELEAGTYNVSGEKIARALIEGNTK